MLLKLIPYAYSHTRSYIRSNVEIRHAWYIEHKSALGSCSDFTLISELTPVKKENEDTPSKTWKEYDVPDSLNELENNIKSIKDLMEEAY